MFTQLLENYIKILNMVDKGHNVDVIYLDLAKTFDKVDHGIGGKVGIWIYTFLSDIT